MASAHIAIALLAITFIAACTDTRSGLIPNWLTLPVIASAPAAQLALGGSNALVSSLLGGFVCALVPLMMFRLGAMGGGDVKLLCGLGTLAGPLAGLELQLLAYNVLVVFALTVLALRGELLAVLRRTWRLIRRAPASAGSTEAAHADFRLGVPIFVATAASLALEAWP
jgi:prepilin peptidase CpaA